MNMKKSGKISFIIFGMVLGLIFSTWSYSAEAKNENAGEKKPERLLIMAVEYPGVVIPVKKTYSIYNSQPD